MGEVVIKIEGISKRYKKGVRNSRSLKQDILNWWSDKKPATDTYSDDYIWALKDVSFEVKQGDILGFLGNNGAGKSTLLKIISRIVKPTEGSVKGIGRIGSLLEVGTGFHGELTGRENIFLNGTILGMSKQEVRSKFDEIVEFSGIGAFLDTPVKRYSSGMYMRLAFAVAVHLDSEILILDEVLAVGDRDFQQKCLNKIRDVATQEGRTVMFVSHNIQAVRDLCNKGLFLSEGRVENFGKTDHVINSFITKSKAYVDEQDFSGNAVPPGNEYVLIQKVSLKPYTTNPQGGFSRSTSILLSVEFLFSTKESSRLNVDFRIFNFSGDYLFNVNSLEAINLKGRFLATCLIPGNFLNSGSYYIDMHFFNHSKPVFEFNKCLSFYIEDKSREMLDYTHAQGIITPQFKIDLNPM